MTNKKQKPIPSIERVEQTKATYNFEVANNHDYFVGEIGWLVHNQSLKGWISKDVYSELSWEQKGVFENAMSKGRVGPQGQAGIKQLFPSKNYKGELFNFELKTPPGSTFGNQRMYGNLKPNPTNLNENIVIFRAFDPRHKP